MLAVLVAVTVAYIGILEVILVCSGKRHRKVGNTASVVVEDKSCDYFKLCSVVIGINTGAVVSYRNSVPVAGVEFCKFRAEFAALSAVHWLIIGIIAVCGVVDQEIVEVDGYNAVVIEEGGGFRTVNGLNGSRGVVVGEGIGIISGEKHGSGSVGIKLDVVAIP